MAHPEQITQFRPISLCNTLYKLVSRILVQRLKPYMAEIINPCQAGFVPGRRTSDNIILVQEVILTLRYWRSRTGYVAIKLDLEKAYDRLEWSFIQETLVFFQLPPNLIVLIMNMISSTRFHILWNGMPFPEVVPSRGVRQGDPLSPYLFILYLERLSLKLEEALRDKLLHPISFRERVRLSHLFFADDIFLFTHAKAKDCTKLSHFLQQFCAASGQLVSITKSRLWFSPNTSRHCKDLVTSILGVPTMNHIRTYLGTPIFTYRRTTSSYQYLVDKIRMKFEGWQTKYLSMAGKAILIKSVVSTILLYTMQTALLPQKISHQLDKMNCSFL